MLETSRTHLQLQSTQSIGVRIGAYHVTISRHRVAACAPQADHDLDEVEAGDGRAKSLRRHVVALAVALAVRSGAAGACRYLKAAGSSISIADNRAPVKVRC